MTSRTKDRVRDELRKECAKAKRLADRVLLAQENLQLVSHRIAELQRELETAPEGWRGF